MSYNRDFATTSDDRRLRYTLREQLPTDITPPPITNPSLNNCLPTPSPPQLNNPQHDDNTIPLTHNPDQHTPVQTPSHSLLPTTHTSTTNTLFPDTQNLTSRAYITTLPSCLNPTFTHAFTHGQTGNVMNLAYHTALTGRKGNMYTGTTNTVQRPITHSTQAPTYTHIPTNTHIMQSHTINPHQEEQVNQHANCFDLIHTHLGHGFTPSHNTHPMTHNDTQITHNVTSSPHTYTSFEPQQINKRTAPEMNYTDRTVIFELIKNIPLCSGANESQLITFLTSIIPIMTLSPHNELDSIKLIFPRTQAHLSSLWLTAIQYQTQWKHLHTQILNRFFPGSQKHRIENQFLHRLQTPTETFIDYVEDIISVNIALKTNYTDTALIEIILSNMAPHIKPHLCLLQKPNTLWDLRNIASEVNSSIISEQTYYQHFSTTAHQQPPVQTNIRVDPLSYLPARTSNTNHTTTQRLINNHGQYIQPTNTRRTLLPTPLQPNRPLCYNCNKPGHLAQHCWNRTNANGTL